MTLNQIFPSHPLYTPPSRPWYTCTVVYLGEGPGCHMPLDLMPWSGVQSKKIKSNCALYKQEKNWLWHVGCYVDVISISLFFPDDTLSFYECHYPPCCKIETEVSLELTYNVIICYYEFHCTWRCIEHLYQNHKVHGFESCWNLNVYQALFSTAQIAVKLQRSNCRFLHFCKVLTFQMKIFC